MAFASITFVIFFIGVVFLNYTLPAKVRNVFLLLVSYFYYICACRSPKYVVVLLAVTAVAYCGGHLIARCDEKPAKKKAVLAACLMFCFGSLFFFKYWNFAADNLNVLLSWLPFGRTLPGIHFMLPLGISFFVFQAAGYLIDIYRGELEPEKNIVNYALFLSFFFQIMAGPINRASSLLNQIRKPRGFSYTRITDGYLTMPWGYFLKSEISDRIAVLVNTVNGQYAHFAGICVLTAMILYSFQIYCDFCGYSCIVVGGARILGLEMMRNFDVPYMSGSVREFWRRWHISLSSWFRDYLYFPLGGSRTTAVKRYRNLIVVFLVSGIWHGASWTFVAWGLFHGLLQVGEILVEKAQKQFGIPAGKKGPLPILLTFLLVSFGWVLFRADSLGSAFGMVRHTICNFNAAAILDAGELFAMGLDAGNWNLLLVCLGVLICGDVLQYHGYPIKETFCKQNILVKDLLVIILVIVIVIAGIWGNGYDAANFIYTQF